MKKRILALLLAGVMIFSQSGAVLATENATAGGTDTETAAVAEPGQAEENAEEDEEPAVSVQEEEEESVPEEKKEEAAEEVAEQV